jgi:hypothetical protein
MRGAFNCIIELMSNYFHCLGLNETADQEAVDRSALRLMAALSRAFESARAGEAASLAKDGVRRAHEELSANLTKYKNAPTRLTPARMRLGQICLASGMVTLDQLRGAIKEQTSSQRQLGEILLDRQYISQEELDGLLIGQDLIAPDEEITEPLALQLIALNLVAEELIIVALLEQKFGAESLGEQLIRRGWVEKEIIDALA